MMRHAQLAPNQLQASKAIRNCQFVLRSCGLDNWTPQYVADLKHDVAVKLDHKDIRYVIIEVIAADETVLYSHKEEFVSTASQGPRPHDSAHGVEVPIIPREQVARYRFLISGPHSEAVYRHLLRLSWTQAPTLQQRVGSHINGEHSAAITGGRTRADIFVSDDARHQGTLIRNGAGQYGFIRDDRLGDVFVHHNFTRTGTALTPGTRLNYLVIQTPRGLQARDVRAA